MTMEQPARSAAEQPTSLTAQLLDDCIQSTGHAYTPGELAYLALTSQIENPIRDRVAYQMHLRLHGTRLDVGREWTGVDAEGQDGTPVARRLDLAIVERWGRRSRRYAPPVHGVAEFKAVRTSHAQTTSELTRVYQLVTDDIIKCVSVDGVVLNAIHAVVLLPHAQIARRNVADHVIKDVFKLMWTGQLFQADAARENAVAGLAARLAPLGPVRTGMIDGGEALGMRVTLPYVILGPVAPETVDALTNNWQLPAVTPP
ncbi:hypothetical protein [Streptomyces sp. ok210]|uniref:hypothetical protein n=1 Tax=Streptomyces sp. ok210 TaxID=1761905 RepID=UPI0008E61683|nr:hypothetical protein [Streptomyces sp. ok210]SFS73144.1 hypothetical protein SAMN04487982_103199 [Streptomyces sp. ok210]